MKKVKQKFENLTKKPIGAKNSCKNKNLDFSTKFRFSENSDNTWLKYVCY